MKTKSQIKRKTQIHVYLSFNGNCREAFTFYKNCLGGTLELQTVEDSPMADQWPESSKKHILHGALTNELLVLLGSDMGGSKKMVKGNTISLALACRSEDQIKRFFYNLSQGGKVTHELHTFFDGTIGAVTDKYGMNWILKY